ncbi:unnamed protein product [Owenia fusiformis]|nr:unnamed protein product [Owenia fusiformis]
MGLAPIFLSEITPVHLRGSLATCHQLGITIGALSTAILGLKQLLGTADRWPYLLLLNIIPASVSLFVLPFLPDSPRYLLLTKNEPSLARKSLQFYRNREDVDADLNEVETEARDAGIQYTMKQVLTDRSLRWPLFIVVFLNIAQQLSGIDAIFFYSEMIFEIAQVEDIQMAIVFTNIVPVVTTMVSVVLIDKMGRRMLLLLSTTIMMLSCILITTSISLQALVPWMSYASIGFVNLYSVGYALGLGAIPLMIGTELFRQGPRPQAMAIGGLVNWLCDLLVSIGFPLLNGVLKQYTFLIFMTFLIVFIVFIFFKVPETKNRTIEEIAQDFDTRTSNDDEATPLNTTVEWNSVVEAK